MPDNDSINRDGFIKFGRKSTAYSAEQVIAAIHDVISGQEITEAAKAHEVNVNTLRSYILNRPVPFYLRKLGHQGLLDKAREIVLDRPRKFSDKQANHPSKRKL